MYWCLGIFQTSETRPVDTTSGFILVNDLDDTTYKINCELKKWLNANELSLNIENAPYVVFRTPNKKLVNPTKLKISDNAIKQVS